LQHIDSTYTSPIQSLVIFDNFSIKIWYNCVFHLNLQFLAVNGSTPLRIKSII